MKTFLLKNRPVYQDLGLLVFRVTVAGSMMSHGWGKFTNFSNISAKFPDPLGLGNALSLGLATGAELFCALFVAIGLFYRLSLMPLIITMGVAAFVIHGGDPFKKMELSLIYLFCFIVMFLMGPGGFSLDSAMKKLRG